jgi:hypothetical protein
MASASAFRLLQSRIEQFKDSLVHRSGTGTRLEQLVDMARAIDALFLRQLSAPRGRARISVEERLANRAGNIALGLFQTTEAQSSTGRYDAETFGRRAWADQTLFLVGRMGRAQYLLSLVETGLAKLQQVGRYDFRIIVDVRDAGVEAIEKEDGYYAATHTNLAEDRTRGSFVHEELALVSAGVAPFRPGGLICSSQPTADEQFFTATEVMTSKLLGSDTFDPGAQLGGLPFATYLRVIAGLWSCTRQHWLCSGTVTDRRLLAHRWALTPIEPRSEILMRLNRITGVTPEQIASALDCLTLTPESTARHCSAVDSALPPLILVSGDHLLLSHAGLGTAPVEYLLHELRFRFQKGWDEAKRGREASWRQELYRLLPPASEWRFVTADTSQLIREGQNKVTDIDALVFDRKTGVLGLFQFKWMDLFGRDMRKRRSRMLNFSNQASDWICNTTTWLNGRATKDVFSRLGLKKSDAERWTETKLFVIGRYASHFSKQDPHDSRAAWGTWGQVLRLTSTAKPDAVQAFSDNPVRWLWDELIGDTPWKKLTAVQHEGAEVIELLGTRIIVHAHM